MLQRKKLEELSKGNQQKIQFITALLLNDPEFIILDEPFSGLDPVNQLLLKRYFAGIKIQRKINFIFYASNGNCRKTLR